MMKNDDNARRRQLSGLVLRTLDDLDETPAFLADKFCAVADCRMERAWHINMLAPLCEPHMLMVWSSVNAHQHEKKLAAERGSNIDHTRKVFEVTDTSRSVVYYVAMNGRVKIGTTRRFVARMQSLYVQPEDVLAVEPGDQKVEYARHQQFGDLRTKGTELFTRDAELDDLIDRLRSMYPNPWQDGIDLTAPLTITYDITPEEAREA